jgi:hypothetical protein
MVVGLGREREFTDGRVASPVGHMRKTQLQNGSKSWHVHRVGPPPVPDARASAKSALLPPSRCVAPAPPDLASISALLLRFCSVALAPCSRRLCSATKVSPPNSPPPALAVHMQAAAAATLAPPQPSPQLFGKSSTRAIALSASRRLSKTFAETKIMSPAYATGSHALSPTADTPPFGRWRASATSS